METTLRAAGFEPVPAPLRSPDPFPRIPAAVYQLGAIELHAYFFGDPVAAGAAARRVTPTRPAGAVFTSNNMLVILRGEGAEVSTRIRRALTSPEAEGGVSR